MSAEMIPVFPLNTPLLPGCLLPLQIFEQRYLDMVSKCMREQSGFVVSLLKPGSESREVIHKDQFMDHAIPFYSNGTLANIVDFGQRDNGLLAITIAGQQHQTLTDIQQLDSGLWVAHNMSGSISHSSPDVVFEEFDEFKELLVQLVEVNGLNIQPLDSLTSEQVMNYLIMLLPISVPVKQQLQEEAELTLRWTGLRQAVAELIRKQNTANH